MPRFFVPPEQIHGQKFILEGSEARHAALVLRKKAGDIIDIFDGKDLSYEGRIESVAPDRIEGVIVAQEKKRHSTTVELILYQALIKGPKWDWLLEKACEVGVTRVVPLLTARTVIKPAKDETRERWKRIALAAAKQCGRADIMDIAPPTPFSDAIESLPGGLTLIPWEKETAKTIKQVVSSSQSKPTRVSLFIGPEGGWEAREVESAVRQGAVAVRLGPTLLRSETAGLVAATLVLSELGVYS